MRGIGLLLTLLLCSCGQSKSPLRPQSSGDGGAGGACDAITGKTTELYLAAAAEEDVSANLQADFIAANVHMVMTDCQANARVVVRCVTAATSVAQLEADCLAPLDEAGAVEGDYFSRI